MLESDDIVWEVTAITMEMLDEYTNNEQVRDLAGELPNEIANAFIEASLSETEGFGLNEFTEQVEEHVKSNDNAVSENSL